MAGGGLAENQHALVPGYYSCVADASLRYRQVGFLSCIDRLAESRGSTSTNPRCRQPLEHSSAFHSPRPKLALRLLVLLPFSADILVDFLEATELHTPSNKLGSQPIQSIDNRRPASICLYFARFSDHTASIQYSYAGASPCRMLNSTDNYFEKGRVVDWACEIIHGLHLSCPDPLAGYSTAGPSTSTTRSGANRRLILDMYCRSTHHGPSRGPKHSTFGLTGTVNYRVDLDLDTAMTMEHCLK